MRLLIILEFYIIGTAFTKLGFGSLTYIHLYTYIHIYLYTYIYVCIVVDVTTFSVHF